MGPAGLDGGKGLVGHPYPFARPLLPGLDLKPVFVDCTSTLDRLLPEAFKTCQAGVA